MAADAEEADRRIEQAIDRDCMHALGRVVRPPEVQMTLNELAQIIGPWIGERYRKLVDCPR